jgi:hypothetical protein
MSVIAFTTWKRSLRHQLNSLACLTGTRNDKGSPLVAAAAPRRSARKSSSVSATV